MSTDNIKKTYHIYLFEQVALGNIKSINRILGGGIPIDIRDGSKTNDAPIHWACSFGNIRVVEELLANGCDVNLKNDLNQTALHLACKANNFDLIKLLLDEGGDITLADINGISPPDLLANPPNPAIVELLSTAATPSRYWSNKFVEMNYHNEISPLTIEVPAESDDPQEILTLDDKLLENKISDGQLNQVVQECNGIKLPVVSTSDIFNKNHSLVNTNPDRPLLVLWPPPQLQRYLPNSNFELSTSSDLVICVANTEIDIYPLLTWSGLIDIFDKYKFHVQVKRSASGAKIRLSINKYVCPGRHQYEILIKSECIYITAADSTSLLYAIQTFVQLIELQSIVSDKATTISIPSLEINDWSDNSNRGLLWNYRKNSRMVPSQMKETVALLSKLRINILYLIIDTDELARSLYSGSSVVNPNGSTQLVSTNIAKAPENFEVI